MQVRNYKCKAPRGPHGATHTDWAYRREAVIWVDGSPARPNMVPFAREMSLWTKQITPSLPVHTKLDQGVDGELDNPYVYSLGALTLSIGAIINDAFDFSESNSPIDPINAEIQRIRFESELVIYSVRFCEAAIKQMLYCTQVPKEMYERASMGKLLAQECVDCKDNGRPRHDISLLGSLAHRFFLCHMLDGCAIDHLQLFARRRNLEAAHSESQSIHPRTAVESRMHLDKSIREIGGELGHLADHLGEIEENMIREMEVFIENYPGVPSHEELMKIPVRNLEQYGHDT